MPKQPISQCQCALRRRGKTIEWLALAQFAIPMLSHADVPTKSDSQNFAASNQWPSLVAQVDADYASSAIYVGREAQGVKLTCAFQRLKGEATSEGLWLNSTAADAAGDRFRVVASSVGRGLPGTLALARKGAVTVDGSMVRFTRPGLVEEYSVSVDGVRQDFVLMDKPEGACELRLELEATGARAEPAMHGARLVLEKSGRRIAYSRLRVTDATGRELPARMEVSSAGNAVAVGDDAHETSRPAAAVLAVLVNDANAVYPVRIDPTFSDENWISISGICGVSGTISDAVADGAGNLYVGGDFNAAGKVRANNVAKWDGSTWSVLGSGTDGPVMALTVSGGEIYAAGQFTVAGGVEVGNVARWDGSKWSALGSGVGGSIYALAAAGGNVYVGGNLFLLGGLEGQGVACWDGNNWTSLDYGVDGVVYALCAKGNNLYVGGHFSLAGDILAGTLVPARNVARWDGSAWSGLGDGVTGFGGGVGVYALAVAGGNVYAGGWFQTAGIAPAANIARWDGTNWYPLGAGMDGGPVATLVVSGDTLYAGGNFSSAGGGEALRVAAWNGSDWSPMGTGVDYGGVQALAMSGGALFAAGGFTQVGGVPAFGVVHWNGADWLPIGPSGITDPVVRALAVSGNELYAGGGPPFFGGDSPSNHVSQWDGLGWSRLGEGMNGKIYALAIWNGELYVGGDFTLAGDVIVNRITKWNGSAWAAVGGGRNSEVRTLAGSPTGLYAGGSFGVARWDGHAWSVLPGVGSVKALAVSGASVYAAGGGGLVHWDGSNWNPLGSGFDGSVHALVLSGNNLYAAGTFSSAGGVPANSVARWSECGWSALGLGITGTGWALAASGSDVYVGGQFTLAGEVAATNIAVWSGNQWLALGSGTDMPVHALAKADNGLFVGGEFITAGDKYALYAAQANVPVGPSPSPSGAPDICVHPESKTVIVEDSVVFTVMAIGTPPLHYQWFKDGEPLVEATNSSHVIPDVQSYHAGNYTVRVSNGSGSELSQKARLTVITRVTLRQALDASSLSWVTGGDAFWTGQSNVTHDGVDAARSGVVGQGGESWVKTTLVGPGTLSFWWKMSAPSGGSFLDFYIDSNYEDGLYDDHDWYHKIVDIPAGTVALTWSYFLSSGEAANENAVWLDEVVWQPATSTRPSLTGITFTPQGALHFNVVGQPNQLYRIQASTNLYDWVTILTNSSPSGLVPVDDATAKNSQRRFYRVVTP